VGGQAEINTQTNKDSWIDTHRQTDTDGQRDGRKDRLTDGHTEERTGSRQTIDRSTTAVTHSEALYHNSSEGLK
jgi:hypothetical protein